MTTEFDPQARAEAVRQLREQLGERVSIDQAVLEAHGQDVSRHELRMPDAVVFPHCVEDVVRVVRVCAQNRVPLIPFGTGTAVEGGVVPIHRGITVDLSGLDRIIEVHPADEDVCVQAGVTRLQLNDHLDQLDSGLLFSVDPGADASLGGMAATGASGSSAVRYGTMRENVLGMTVVLASGDVMQVGGRARKSSAGYDLTHLFIGSEGTLGIIVELTLRLRRKPLAVSSAVCGFPTVRQAVDAVMLVMAQGIPMARIELLDEVQMRAVNRYSKLDYDEIPTLFFEFHGTARAVAEESEAVGKIVAQQKGTAFRWATDEIERRKLWQARYDAYYASLALRSGAVGYVTDVCVPITELAASIEETKFLLRSTSIPAPLFGHVGDGNFHVVFALDPTSPAELNEVQQLHREIVDRSLARGGTCTGEHGIGIGKRDALQRQHRSAMGVMRDIKKTLDPLNIMNPGKVIAEV